MCRYLREHLSALIPKDEDSEGTEIPDVLSAAVEAVNDVMSALQVGMGHTYLLLVRQYFAQNSHL